MSRKHANEILLKHRLLANGECIFPIYDIAICKPDRNG